MTNGHDTALELALLFNEEGKPFRRCLVKFSYPFTFAANKLKAY